MVNFQMFRSQVCVIRTENVYGFWKSRDHWGYQQKLLWNDCDRGRLKRAAELQVRKQSYRGKRSLQRENVVTAGGKKIKDLCACVCVF